MMKKLYLLATMVAMVACLTACGGDDAQEIGSDATDAADTATTEDAGESTSVAVTGYTWEVEDVLLYIDAAPADTVDVLDEEPDYFESASCAYDGTDKIYTYNNYVVTFYEGDGYDGISLITLTSDLVSTTEGICIGSSYDDVIAAYGEPTSDTGTLVSYEDDGTEIRFVISEASVISIEIAKIF